MNEVGSTLGDFGQFLHSDVQKTFRIPGILRGRPPGVITLENGWLNRPQVRGRKMWFVGFTATITFRAYYRSYVLEDEVIFIKNFQTSYYMPFIGLLGGSLSAVYVNGKNSVQLSAFLKPYLKYQNSLPRNNLACGQTSV